MPQPIATQLGTFTGAGAGTPRAGQVGDHTFAATLAGSGAVSATVLIEASNDLLGWSTIATIVLTGTNAAAGQVTSTTSYAYWRATVSALTGASVVVTAATEQVTDASALTSLQKSRLLAVLPATESLVSGAWNLATSGTWRPAALGALPRFSVSGGASGGTWALSYRNAAGTVTSDPAETVTAGVTDVTPVYLDDATEIMVTVTGTVTVELK